MAALKPGILYSEMASWPLHEYSRFVQAGGVRWHVQSLGKGPVILLLHGTGASTHSWRHVAIELARQFEVVMCDLPGHGFSSPINSIRSQTTVGSKAMSPTLPAMSRALAALLIDQGWRPGIVAGHSAGAAIALQLSLDDAVRPEKIVSINGAFLPFPGVARHLFAPLAHLMALNPLIPRLVSWRAQRGRLVKRLLDETGSRLDPTSIDLYARLISQSQHVSGALEMMANWDLQTLSRRLGELETPLQLIVGQSDRTVPPQQADVVAKKVKQGYVVRLPGLGHLAHEEKPDLLVQEICQREVARHGSQRMKLVETGMSEQTGQPDTCLTGLSDTRIHHGEIHRGEK